MNIEEKHFAEHKKINIIISYMDGEINTIYDMTLASQRIIARLLDLIDRSELSEDKEIRDEIKSMKMMGDVIESNLSKIDRLREIEDELKSGDREKQEPKKENNLNNKDNSSYR